MTSPHYVVYMRDLAPHALKCASHDIALQASFDRTKTGDYVYDIMSEHDFAALAAFTNIPVDKETV